MLRVATLPRIRDTSPIRRTNSYWQLFRIQWLTIAVRASMEWTEGLISAFIGEVRSYECLWNPKDRNKRSRTKVKQALVSISEKMNIHVDDVKNKKDNLFQTYRNYRRKVNASIKAGNTVYKPSWIYYDKLDAFLHAVYTPIKPRISTVENDTENLVKYRLVGGTLKLKANICPHIFDCQKEVKPRAASGRCARCALQTTRPERGANPKEQTDELEGWLDQECQYNSEEDIKPSITDTELTVTDGEWNSPIPRSQEKNTCVDGRVDHLETSTKPNLDSKQRDECEIYGELLAVKLRKIEETKRQLVMHAIDNILYEAICDHPSNPPLYITYLNQLYSQSKNKS